MASQSRDPNNRPGTNESESTLAVPQKNQDNPILLLADLIRDGDPEVLTSVANCQWVERVLKDALQNEAIKIDQNLGLILGTMFFKYGEALIAAKEPIEKTFGEGGYRFRNNCHSLMSTIARVIASKPLTEEGATTILHHFRLKADCLSPGDRSRSHKETLDVKSVLEAASSILASLLFASEEDTRLKVLKLCQSIPNLKPTNMQEAVRKLLGDEPSRTEEEVLAVGNSLINNGQQHANWANPVIAELYPYVNDRDAIQSWACGVASLNDSVIRDVHLTCRTKERHRHLSELLYALRLRPFGDLAHLVGLNHAEFAYDMNPKVLVSPDSLPRRNFTIGAGDIDPSRPLFMRIGHLGVADFKPDSGLFTPNYPSVMLAANLIEALNIDETLKARLLDMILPSVTVSDEGQILVGSGTDQFTFDYENGEFSTCDSCQAMVCLVAVRRAIRDSNILEKCPNIKNWVENAILEEIEPRDSMEQDARSRTEELLRVKCLARNIALVLEEDLIHPNGTFRIFSEPRVRLQYVNYREVRGPYASDMHVQAEGVYGALSELHRLELIPRAWARRYLRVLCKIEHTENSISATAIGYAMNPPRVHLDLASGTINSPISPYSSDMGALLAIIGSLQEDPRYRDGVAWRKTLENLDLDFYQE